MNERIKELYLEASEQFKIVQDQGLPAPYQTRAFAEKFAELIVQECAKYMYENFPETKYKVDYMRKHMGDPYWCELIGEVK